MTMLGVTPNMLTADFDKELACSDDGWEGLPNTPQCPNPARWQYRLTCGHSFLVCNEHRDETLSAAGVTCNCGKQTKIEHIAWRHL